MSIAFRVAKAYKQFIFNLSATENSLYLFYYRYLYRPSSGSVAGFLNSYSQSNGPITFLQIGANDGFIHDPLHAFIKRDNWKGVMLEPQPDVYNNFLVKLHSRRQGVIPVNAALDASDGKRPLYRIALSNERWATGMSSFNKEQLVSKLTDEKFLRRARRQGVELPSNGEGVVIADQVRTISPETLLEKYQLVNINILAIDVEGFDYEIIKMIDLGRITPEVILYEEVHFDEQTAQECRAHLKGYGYSCITIKKDVIAVRDLK